jgi:hypothetical protein
MTRATLEFLVTGTVRVARAPDGIESPGRLPRNTRFVNRITLVKYPETR